MKVATCLVGALLLCTNSIGVRAVSNNAKDTYFNEDTWALIRTEDGVVENLVDLRTGVYSLELASTRSSCGSSRLGM